MGQEVGNIIQASGRLMLKRVNSYLTMSAGMAPSAKESGGSDLANPHSTQPSSYHSFNSDVNLDRSSHVKRHSLAFATSQYNTPLIFQIN